MLDKLNEMDTKILIGIIAVLVVIGVVLLITGLQSSICNDNLLARFKRTDAAHISETLTGAGGIVKDGRWEIYPRGSGCVASFSAEVNGKRGADFEWFIDPTSSTFEPDSSAAQGLAAMTGLYTRPNNQIPR